MSIVTVQKNLYIENLVFAVGIGTTSAASFELDHCNNCSVYLIHAHPCIYQQQHLHKVCTLCSNASSLKIEK